MLFNIPVVDKHTGQKGGRDAAVESTYSIYFAPKGLKLNLKYNKQTSFFVTFNATSSSLLHGA